jgi:transcriptional regulator with XRE-family HTH domain
MYLSNSIDIKRVVAASDTRRIISGMRHSWVDRAKRRMKILGKTQEDLKAALGVKTRGAVGHYFAGRNDLSTGQVVALASALELSVEELLTGKRPDGAQGISDIPDHILQLARTITDMPPEKTKAIQIIVDADLEKVRALLVLFREKTEERMPLPPTVRYSDPKERSKRAMGLKRTKERKAEGGCHG